jgi:hypothetical protein
MSLSIEDKERFENVICDWGKLADSLAKQADSESVFSSQVLSGRADGIRFCCNALEIFVTNLSNLKK